MALTAIFYEYHVFVYQVVCTVINAHYCPRVILETQWLEAVDNIIIGSMHVNSDVHFSGPPTPSDVLHVVLCVE